MRVFVNLYTYITLPYYYFNQKPWNRLKKANRCRSKLENPKDQNSAWVIDEQQLTHPVMRPTVTEILACLVEYHGQHTPILGMNYVFIFILILILI